MRPVAAVSGSTSTTEISTGRPRWFIAATVAAASEEVKACLLACSICSGLMFDGKTCSMGTSVSSVVNHLPSACARVMLERTDTVVIRSSPVVSSTGAPSISMTGVPSREPSVSNIGPGPSAA